MSDLELTRLFDGKKFGWDGVDYPQREAAAEVLATYQRDGFEVRLIQSDGHFRLYTRRVVKQSSAST